jgi:hypothetical protein
VVAVEKPEDSTDEEQDSLIEGAWYRRNSERTTPPKRSRYPTVANDDLYSPDRPSYEAARDLHTASVGW